MLSVVKMPLKVMEITLLIMENHANLFLNFCGNPEVNLMKINPLYTTRFPIQIDEIRMGLPIIYFKGSQVRISKL